MKENIAALNQTSITAINKMNDGASRIAAATNNFVEAGNKVSGVMTQSERVSHSLSQSASQLAQASGSLEGMLNQYAATRDTIAHMVEAMGAMLERAKQEAGMNQQIIQTMQETVEEFKKINNEADSSFDAIAKRLAETLTQFRSDMAEHNTEFHMHHADTLNLVASAYEPLAAAIGGLSDMMARNQER